jgi:hypothetical protein
MISTLDQQDHYIINKLNNFRRTLIFSKIHSVDRTTTKTAGTLFQRTLWTVKQLRALNLSSRAINIIFAHSPRISLYQNLIDISSIIPRIYIVEYHDINPWLYSEADPGFCVRWDESRRGSGDRLRSPAGPRAEPPRKLLGFEYLGSFSVNNFEAFCECDEVY